MSRKPNDQVQLKLRFDERLRKRLEREAAMNNRSLNGEIIHRLEQSLTMRDFIQATAIATASAVSDLLVADGGGLKKPYEMVRKRTEGDKS